ncbi:MAG TPA: ABC transporter permease subunit, partial [Phototrophicaceae bacterium]|nr:ABC transporter permease subunit [Phototrophicaceae bacterium]
MFGVTFIETLRRHWWQIVWWGSGIAVLGFYTTSIIQDVDMLKQYAEMVKNIKPGLLQIFGIKDAAALTTPEGFISFAFFSYSLLVLAVFGVMAGLNITSNDEETGIMDMVLSMPVSRWSIIVEKFAAYVVIAAGIIAVSYAGLMMGISSSTLELNTARITDSTINMLPSILLVMAVTLFTGTLARRRSTAIAISAVFVVASYFINSLGSAASGTLADSLRFVSFFNYYDNSGVMTNGLNIANIAILLVVTMFLVAGSLWFYRRR